MSPAPKGLCHLGLGTGQTWLPVSDKPSGNPALVPEDPFAPPTLLGLTNQEQADVRLGAPEQGVGLRPAGDTAVLAATARATWPELLGTCGRH